MTSRRLPYPAAVILVAALYFGAARLGLLAAVAQEVVSSAWPPAGFALAALVLFGPRLWPGVALGAFLVNATSGVPVPGAAGIAVGNTLEAVIGAWLLRRVPAFDPGLERLRDVLALAGVAALATVVSATIGVAGLRASGVIASGAMPVLWLVWWSGDAVGILLVAPLLLTWADALRRPPSWSWPRTVEAAALAVGLVLLTNLVLRMPRTYVYAIFPLVVWAALRFGPRGAATSVALVAGFTVGLTVQGFGPFVGSTTPTQSLALLQIFLTVIAGTGLVLAAVTRERVRAERAAGESEQRFRLLVESVQDCAIIMLDPSGRVASWNEAAERITGYPADDIIGRHFACFYAPEHAAAGTPERNLAAAARGAFAEEAWRVRRDGSRFWASVAIAPVHDATGALLGFAKVTRDLSERRRAEDERREREELLRAVFDRTAVGIAITDLAGRFVQANHVYETMLGYSQAELRQRTFLEVTHEEDRATNAALAMELLGGRRDAFRVEKRYRRKDGEVIWVRNTVSVIVGEDGPRFLIAIVEDITERKRAEDELHASRRELQALSHGLLEAQELERTRIARDLHDSIGQALTAVKLTLETRRRTAADGALTDSVHVIERAIDDVRSLSFELRPALLDDLGLPAALGAFARRQADRAGLELALTVQPISAPIPHATATACFRIAQEAVTNVVRHARARRLDVGLEAAGDTLELVIGDDGVGFPPPESGTPAERHLGLLGMQERAQLVGGEVCIESHSGGGTMIRARFPLAGGHHAA